MFKFLNVFIILFFAQLVSTVYAQLDTTSITRYSIENGLPSNTVYDIVEDKDGFIWMGTDAGLCRYDGQYFKTYTSEDGAPDIEILDLFVDSKNRIWCNSFNGKIFFIEDNKVFDQNNTSFLKNWSYPFWSQIMEDDSGNIILKNSKGVVEISTESFQLIFEDPAGTKDYVVFFNKINGEYQIVHKKEIGDYLSIIDSSGQTKFDTIVLPGIFKNVATIGLENQTLCVSSTDLYLFDGSSFDRVHSFNSGENRILRALFFDDYFWVLTLNNGLYQIPTSNPFANQYSYLEDVATTSICKDQGNNYWISSLGDGVYKIEQSISKIINSGNGLVYDAVKTLCVDEDIVLMGDKYLNLYSYEDGILETIKSSDVKMSSQHINCIEKIEGKGYYIGTDIGTESINFDLQDDGQDLQKLMTKDIKQLNDGSIAFVRLEGVDIIGINGVNDIGRINTSKRPLTIEETDEGRIWVGTFEGVYYYDDKKWDQGNLLKGIPQDRIMDLKGKNLDLCICTANDGLYFMQEGDIKHLSITDGLISNHCNSVFIENENKLWYASNSGLNNIIIDEGKIKSIDLFDSRSGLISNQIYQVEITNGKIYLATPKGLQIIEQKELEKGTKSSSYIDAVIVNNENIYDISETKLNLSSDQKNIEIGFSTINFNSTPSYLFKLEGFDDHWIPTNDRSAKYYNLPYGDYTFKVKISGDDESQRVSQLDFNVKAKFWETWLFKFVLLAISLLGSLLFFRYRTNVQKKELELSRLKTEAEIKALRAQINPHFLFNAMNSIQDIIFEKDVVKANKYISELSKLMRMTLEQSKTPWITLADEIKTLELYLSIESLRFDSKFDMEVEVDPNIDVDNTMMPSCILQPLVENSIWHGLLDKKTKGKLKVSFLNEGNRTLCVVDDDGVGFKKNIGKEKLHNSTGLKNLRERIDLINEGMRSKINISIEESIVSTTEYPGARVEISIPNELNNRI